MFGNLLGLILALFVIAVFFRVDFFFYILYLFFGAYFLSRIWTRHALSKVTCTRDYYSRAFPGERVAVRLRVKNASILPLPWLRVHESLPVQLKSPNFFRSVFSLLTHEQKDLQYELDCRRRGYYHVGPTTLISGDLFGMLAYEKCVATGDYLIVYPTIVALKKIGLPAQTPFGSIATKQRLYEDPSRMVGVRPYQSGDSLRHIHWKTTATTGNLQVKRFEPAISVEAQIFLNLNTNDYTSQRTYVASELAITTAASIAHYLTGRRQTIGLCSNGFDPLAEGLDPAEVQMESVQESQGAVATGAEDLYLGEREQLTGAQERVPPPGLGAAASVMIDQQARLIVLPPRRGQTQLMHILDTLARVSINATVPFDRVLEQASLQLTWGGTGIIITPDISDSLWKHILLMKRAGFHVVLIVVDAKSPFEEIRNRAHQIGVQAYEVWRDSDLDEWRG